MPVSGMVEYDCNVSLITQPYGSSTTIIVVLPDGMEKHSPKALEDALYKGMLKRLSVVATEMMDVPSGSNFYDSARRYVIEISTDRGFRLGSLKLDSPFSTGWKGQIVNLAENYFPTEIEGYIERVLREYLVIRVNQRMPPLPRVGANPGDQRMDLVFSIPTQAQEAAREAERRLYEFAGTRHWMTAAEELLTEPARDVTERQEINRTDVALRGGSQGRDVATMGTELNL